MSEGPQQSGSCSDRMGGGQGIHLSHPTHPIHHWLQLQEPRGKSPRPSTSQAQLLVQLCQLWGDGAQVVSLMFQVLMPRGAEVNIKGEHKGQFDVIYWEGSISHDCVMEKKGFRTPEVFRAECLQWDGQAEDALVLHFA